MRLRECRQVVRKRWIFPALVLVFATACLVGPNYQTPKSDVAPQYLTSPAANPQPLNAVDAYWWRTLNDPVLDGLVEAAYRNNLTLQIAGVRVLETRANLAKTIGNLWPQTQGAAGSLNWSQTNRPTTLNVATDNLGFTFSWELDVWGKIRRGIESDQAAYLGTIASYDDVLVTVIADTASNYVNIRTAGSSPRRRAPS